jgi:hypothetical protein
MLNRYRLLPACTGSKGLETIKCLPNINLVKKSTIDIYPRKGSLRKVNEKGVESEKEMIFIYAKRGKSLEKGRMRRNLSIRERKCILSVPDQKAMLIIPHQPTINSPPEN